MLCKNLRVHVNFLCPLIVQCFIRSYGAPNRAGSFFFPKQYNKAQANTLALGLGNMSVLSFIVILKRHDNRHR